MQTYIRTYITTLCVRVCVCSSEGNVCVLMNERHSLLALIVSLRLLLLLLSCLAGLCAVTGHLVVEKKEIDPAIIISLQANNFFFSGNKHLQLFPLPCHLYTLDYVIH